MLFFSNFTRMSARGLFTSEEDEVADGDVDDRGILGQITPKEVVVTVVD